MGKETILFKDRLSVSKLASCFMKAGTCVNPQSERSKCVSLFVLTKLLGHSWWYLFICSSSKSRKAVIHNGIFSKLSEPILKTFNLYKALYDSGITDAGLSERFRTSRPVSFEIDSGKILIRLTAAQTTVIKPGRYVYDVVITDSFGVKNRVIEGMVLVTEGVTR